MARDPTRVPEPRLERRRTAFRPGGRDRRAAQHELGRGRPRAEPVRALRQLDQAGFNNLDHNRDRRITANEWHFDVETFRRVDRNRDGALDQTEFLGGDVDDVRDDSFDNLDWNNNGRVERTEWYWRRRGLHDLDRNRDGVLSRFEVVGGVDTPNDTWDQFASLDYNRNGSIAATNGIGRPSASTGAIRTATACSRARSSRVGGAPGAAGTAERGRSAANGARESAAALDRPGIVVRAGDTVTMTRAAIFR